MYGQGLRVLRQQWWPRAEGWGGRSSAALSYEPTFATRLTRGGDTVGRVGGEEVEMEEPRGTDAATQEKG